MPVRAADRLEDFRRFEADAALPAIVEDASVVDLVAEDAGEPDDEAADAPEAGEAPAPVGANWDEERARLEAGFEEQMETARRAWAEQCADAMYQQIEEGFSDLTAAILTMLRDRAAPVFEDLVRRGAVDGFAEVVQRLRGDGVSLDISGPDELVDALRIRMADAGEDVRFKVGETCELRLETDVCVAETRIDEWLRTWRGEVA